MRKQIMFGVLAVVMLFGVVGLASADIVSYPGAGSPAAATNSADKVDVKATVNPKITLTIDTPDLAQTVDFLDADPGVVETAIVTVAVDSNKAWTGTSVRGGQFAELGLTTTLSAAAFSGPKGNAATAGNTKTDTYTINVPWTTDPNPYLATVQYTVTQ